MSLALSALGMSLKVTDELQAAFEAAGLRGIIREDRNSWWREDLAYLCQQMYYLAVKSGGANLLLWGGQVKDRESAEALAREWLHGMEQEMKDGVVVNFAIRVMLGRKPL